MKLFTIIMLSLLAFMASPALAQAPEGIPYQAAVRNASGDLIVSQSVSFQISVLQGTATGTAVYVEEQSVTTNAYGMASLTIGDGTASSGTIASIDWANGPYFLKIEIDPAGGTSYTDLGATQLMSVPFALYAKNAENAGDPDQWDENSNGLHTTNNVGIGAVSTASFALTVRGNSNIIGAVGVDGSVDVTGQVTVSASASSVPSIRTDYVTGVGKGIQLKNNNASDYWEIYEFSTGRLSFYFGSDEKGNIDETSGAYTAVSDARMKSNVRPLNGILADVMKLNPSVYNFKKGDTERDYIGFIAQDVEQVFPQIVHHHADTDGAGIDQYTVDYSGFGVLAISALQEQQKIIDAQEERLATLEAELEALKESLGK